jgi:predicted metalloprotease with PDZ domain
MKKNFTYLFLFLWASGAAHGQKLSYTLGMSKPHTHYFEVETRFEALPANVVKQGYVDFKMPVWAPGSYLVREFAKNVEGEMAKDLAGKPLPVQKMNKNTWRVTTGKATGVVFNYLVYAFEISVRTSFLDAAHGFVSPSGVFVFPDGFVNLPSTIQVKPYQDWQQISTSLAPVGGDKWTLQSPNYDLLADSPIEIGTHRIFEFQAAGLPHRFAMQGVTAYDEARIVRDVTKIVDVSTKIFGEHPCKDYTFIVHHSAGGSGGLEHLNSTVLGVSRYAYASEGRYLGFLSLVAHEYFHLWNVKRLRPAPLGPFDYDNENYTRLLWMAEGWTAYYDNLIVRRAGLSDEAGYLRDLAGNISEHENAPGSRVQAVTDASFDAWIKYYRRNENSANSSISYYGSGARLASMLDLEILHATGAKKSLDDVIRFLYQEYYKKLDRGFTEAELKKAIETVAGKNLDEFFAKHVYGTEKIDYNKHLAHAGLQLNVVPDRTASLGATLEEENGRVVVRSVRKGAAGYEHGLNVNDEIVAIDGFRLTSAASVNNNVASRRPGDRVLLTVARDGLLLELQVTLDVSGVASYYLAPVSGGPSPAQKAVYDHWVGNKH